MPNLSHDDGETLTHNPTEQVRNQLAATLASDINAKRYNDTQSHLAYDIFRILLRNASQTIQVSVAQQLAHLPDVPRDIILKLASEPAVVSSPVLKYSPVLTENDLIAIIRSTEEVAKLCAVAQRDHISEIVSGCLLSTDNVLVFQNLFHNKNASIHPNDLLRTWEMIATHPALLETLVHRGGLPLFIAEKIYHIAATDLQETIASQYTIHTPSLNKATRDAKEWAMLGLMQEDRISNLQDDKQIEELTESLHASGRLTHSLLVRALCTGNIRLFESAIARMAGIPRVNARILMMDAGDRGFKAIYDAATMPEGFLAAIQTLLRIALQETEFGHTKPLDFRKRIIDQIYQKRFNKTVENMEYILSIIDSRPHAQIH